MTAQRRLDITHVLAAARAGGLERVVEMLATGQAARGHVVSVRTILPGGGAEPPLAARLRDNGISVSVQRVAGRDYGGERREFSEWLAAMPRGIVHTHGYRADVVYAPAAARLGFGTVTTLHGFVGGDVKNRLYEYLQRRVVRGFDRVVTVSKPLFEQMRRFGVDAERLALIPNAFMGSPEGTLTRPDARDRLGLNHDGAVVGWVGRLSREKGADVLVDALPMLSTLSPTVVFLGEGAEADRLRAQAVRLGVERMIRWAGTVDRASSMFRAFDVLVLSSRTEGTPIVLFEAMASKVPVVATAVGGIPDVVSSAEAMLVPPLSPAALADAIRSTLENRPGAADRAESAARVLAERYGPESWLDHYEQAYAAALRRRASRR